MVNWVNQNWFELSLSLILICAIIYRLIAFVKLPAEARIENVKSWLLLAVVKAEKELGEKTGALKLRLVYDMAVSKFSWLATAVSFDTFSEWVDEALVEMKRMLNDNKAVAEYVEGE